MNARASIGDAVRSTVALRRTLAVLICLLIVKVTIEVLLGYENYFPPRFDSDFLRGRERYFFGVYRWAFYPHILAGPAALFSGIILISEPFRRRFPKWHRHLGRIHAVNALCVVAPSGLWLGWYASSGPVATMSFMIQAVLTGMCAALGWRAAMKRHFAIHRLWMWRCFLLLCSAVVIRLLGGLGSIFEVQAGWYDPLISWASWLLPLGLWEWSRIKSQSRVSPTLPLPARAIP